jgi:hypothetical protein
METQPQPPPFIKALPKILAKVEMIAFVLAILGIVMKMMNWSGGNEMVIMGMATIAITLFQTAFLPPAQKQSPFLSIVNKLGYISSAVGVIGTLFALMHFEGAKEMLQISAASLVGTVVGAGFLMLKENDTLSILRPLLMRAVPILLCCLYILFQLQTS